MTLDDQQETAMKVRLLVACALFAVLSGAAVGEAVAEDFTFHVPVKLVGLPADASAIDVWCSAYVTQGNVVAAGASPPVAPGPNGNYSGTIIVKLNASPGKNPADAKKYDCRLRVNFQVASGVQSKSGTPRVIVAEGDLPQ